MPELAPSHRPDALRLAVRALVDGEETARFGIAVSGGPDSMALLDLAVQAWPGRVAAATLDHGLRAESADEAAMVARWCAERRVPHATLAPETAVSGNIQDWARRQRYAQLEAWRAGAGLDWILTAHHADDQLETLLMRLNRGSGVGGLAGVRARAGRVLRPLLTVRKAQLQAHADQAGLPYVLDPSNADPRFDRAALRKRLDGVDWIDAEAAARSAAALAEAEAALQWTVAGLAATHIHPSTDAWVLDRTDLPRELLRRLLIEMLCSADPEIVLPRGEALDRAIAAARAGRQASLGDWLLRGGAVWTLSPAPPRR